MSSNIEKALKAADETKALRIGSNILKEVSELFLAQYSGMEAVIVADTNTYAVAGSEIKEYLTQAGIQQQDPD